MPVRPGHSQPCPRRAAHGASSPRSHARPACHPSILAHSACLAHAICSAPGSLACALDFRGERPSALMRSLSGSTASQAVRKSPLNIFSSARPGASAGATSLTRLNCSPLRWNDGILRAPARGLRGLERLPFSAFNSLTDFAICEDWRSELPHCLSHIPSPPLCALIPAAHSAKADPSETRLASQTILFQAKPFDCLFTPIEECRDAGRRDSQRCQR
jgi:hypothetical protein